MESDAVELQRERTIRKARAFVVAASFALACGASAVQAADWIMQQGTEPADTGAYRFFGTGWLTYANNYGCDAFFRPARAQRHAQRLTVRRSVPDQPPCGRQRQDRAGLTY